MARSQAIGIPTHTFTLKVSHCDGANAAMEW